MVKFSHAINLNSSPDWREYYLQYSRLKKITYVLEKAVLGLGNIPLSTGELEEMVVLQENILSDSILEQSPKSHSAGEAKQEDLEASLHLDHDENHAESDEKTPLLLKPSTISGPSLSGNQSKHLRTGSASGSATAVAGGLSIEKANTFFCLALDAELDKICAFYRDKEYELIEALHVITLEITKQERNEESYLHSLWSTSNAYHTIPQGNITAGGSIGPLPSNFTSAHTPTTLGSMNNNQSLRLNSNNLTINPLSSTEGPPLLSPGMKHTEATSSTGPRALDIYDDPANLQSYHSHNSEIGTFNGELHIGRVLQPQPSFLPYLIWSSPSLKHTKNALTKRLTHTFVLLCDLRDYVDINETGFSKVLKKYEKVVGGKVKQSYLALLETRYPFLPTTKKELNETIDRLVAWYARIASDGKIQVASSDLKSHLREHIVWERNTIWRDMVEQERRSGNIGFVPPTDPDDLVSAQSRKRVVIEICGVGVWVPRVIPASVLATIAAIVTLFLLTQIHIFPTTPMNNCFAILVFASIMWAFEAIPLFVTSMCVPVLVVLLRVMTDPKTGDPLPAKDGAKKIFSEMFGPVIMLLLGGFSLAAALSKHNIAKSLASLILSRAGSKPHWVLLCNMFVSTFASMWISNVAAPVLCFSLIGPILRNLPRKSPYARCLVLGIAMAANVGGMASPIASPQNVIAMGILDKLGPVSWIQWFLIATPIALTLDLLICILLLAIYQPVESAMPPEITASGSSGLSFNAKQWFVLGISLGTILLWCAASSLEGIVGDMGVIAILPIVVFYGTGILTKDDWNSMLWSVVMLAMGGISLGKAVESSGLLHELASNLTPLLQNLSPFYCVALLSGIVVIVTSFISHTVGALIILPVVMQIGVLLPDPRPRTLVMAACLMCSGGMALPVSSFPNMNAISLEDSRGEAWLNVADFLGIGILSSLLAWLSVLAMGYPIMTLIGFG